MASFFRNFWDRVAASKGRSLLPTRKGFFRLIAGLGIFLVVLGVSAELTSRPQFCSTCHYMAPYIESWKASAHSDVTCVKCHFPPGIEGTIEGKMAGLVQVVNYIGRSYTRRKPWAEIDDVSCLQCHETQTLGDTVSYKGVVFDHQSHLGELRLEMELRCTSCHSQVVQGEHILVTETACFLCHLKGGAGTSEVDIRLASAGNRSLQLVAAHRLDEGLANCQTCHDWASVPKEDLSHFRFDHAGVVEQGMSCVQCHNQTVVGDGYVPEDNCNNCHHEEERLSKYNEPELLHRIHISENKIECTQCHLRIQHKIQRITAESTLNCATCHQGTHQEQLMLYTGAADDGINGDPNPMMEAGLNCASCHISHRQLVGQASVQVGSSEACESCHGEGYGRLLQLWQRSAETKLRQLNQEVVRVERTVRQNRGDSLALSHVEKAKYTMHLVEVGKAVHNITFSERLIRLGYDNLNQALRASGASYQISGGDTASIVPGECANCHTGVESITSTFQGRDFSHNRHVVSEAIACETCHSNATRHGRLVLTPQDCNSCHHDPQKRDLDKCATCHETAAALYAGTYMDRDEPDLMFDEEVPCSDCHISKGRVRLPDVAVCVDCHDEDYGETGKEWLQDVATLLAEVKTLLQQTPAASRGTDTYRQAQRVVADLERSAGRGLHNYELTMDLLKEVRTQLQTLSARP